MFLSSHILRLAVYTVLGSAIASAASAQTCPTTSWGMGSQSGHLSAPSFDSSIADDFGSGRLYFEDSGDSLSMNVSTGMFGGGSNLAVRQTYVLVGASPATPISFYIRWPVAASIESCSNNYLVARLLFQGDVVAGGTYFPPGGEVCGQAVSFTADVAVTRGAGDPFTIVQDTRANLDFTGTGTVKTALRFEGLPPGVAVVSCFGDTLGTGPSVVGVGAGRPFALGFEAVTPHPARGAIHLAISVPRGGPAMLQLMDVAGRLVASRVLDASTGARREVALGGSLAPGTYFLRLSQGMSSATRSVTVLP